LFDCHPRSNLFVVRDLFRKPVSTSWDHALAYGEALQRSWPAAHGSGVNASSLSKGKEGSESFEVVRPTTQASTETNGEGRNANTSLADGLRGWPRPRPCRSFEESQAELSHIPQLWFHRDKRQKRFRVLY
jgi:hypothetical protein